jgi:hypothetical protein
MVLKFLIYLSRFGEVVSLTVLWGDTGKVAYGTLKTFTITGATPRETLLGTPVSLYQLSTQVRQAVR